MQEVNDRASAFNESASQIAAMTKKNAISARKFRRFTLKVVAADIQERTWRIASRSAVTATKRECLVIAVDQRQSFAIRRNVAFASAIDLLSDRFHRGFLSI
jgi:hypothetical protein